MLSKELDKEKELRLQIVLNWKIKGPKKDVLGGSAPESALFMSFNFCRRFGVFPSSPSMNLLCLGRLDSSTLLHPLTSSQKEYTKSPSPVTALAREDKNELSSE